MPQYIINKEKTDGRNNEVHTTDCSKLPTTPNRISLGWHINAIEAVSYAKKIGYKSADGCYYCCNEAHRG